MMLYDVLPLLAVRLLLKCNIKTKHSWKPKEIDAEQIFQGISKMSSAYPSHDCCSCSGQKQNQFFRTVVVIIVIDVIIW